VRGEVTDFSGDPGRGFCASFEGKCAWERISSLGKTSVGRVGHNDQFWGLDLGDGCGSLVVTIGASAKLSDRCKAWRPKGPFILGTFVYARPASHSSACFFSCWSLRDNWTA